MEQEAPAPTDQLDHGDQTQIINTPKSSTTTTYFPPPQELDYRMIYSGFFPSRLFPQHHEPSTYLAMAGGGGGGGGMQLLESSSRPGATTQAAFNNYGSSNSSRWPREETMSLLQIRSRLHSSFKQATQKGQLWDEVSRFMYEEHGYKRSGKKCREKFENLYKYYKKTKETKSGKHDGKHYRFFRQLEALYGDHPNSMTDDHNNHIPAVQSNPVVISSPQVMVAGEQVSPNFTTTQHNSMKLACDQSCLSLCNHNASSSNWITSSTSSEDNDLGRDKKNRMKRKIKEFIDVHMKSLMEKQQLCMERVMETIEQKEKERVLREEEWRQEAEARLEREHRYWASERAWMKARDAALTETLQQFTSARTTTSSSSRQDVASSHMQQQLIPFSSYSSMTIQQANSMKNEKRDLGDNVRDPPAALYSNQLVSQDRWFTSSDHQHETNGFLRFMMSDCNGNTHTPWDGSNTAASFGLKNNGDHENHRI